MKMLMVLFMVLSLSSCGMMLGLKEIKTAGGTVIKFNSGLGFEASMSESDTLENTRSIKP